MFGDFFTCHPLCIVRHKCLTDLYDIHKNHRGKEPPLLHCLLITLAQKQYVPTQLLHVKDTRWQSLPGRACYCRWDRPGNHFYRCTLIMTYSFWTGGSMHDTSSVTTGWKSSWDRERVGASHPVAFIDHFWLCHCPRELNAYLHWEENSALFISQVMFCGEQTHYWQWHKQLFSSYAERKETSKQRRRNRAEGRAPVLQVKPQPC